MAVLFQRSPSNPILTAEDMPYPAEAVLNPGVTEQEGEVVLLLRVEERSGRSNIHVARSKDGVSNWRIEKTPLLKHGLPDNRYEGWGCEDARVTWLASEKCWYIVYTAYSDVGAAVGLARTSDLEKVERIGLIFPPNNKDAAIFPDKFGDRWAALHRPDAGGGVENIWIAYSPDLIHWGEPHVVLAEGRGPSWDAVTVGTGPPPLRTRMGWLLLYHGVKMYGGNRVYRVGAALLDAERPYRVLARTPGNLFKPTEVYETSGIMPNVVFPTGWVRRGDELWIYYGAADTCIGLTIASVESILSAFVPETPG